MPDRIIRLFAVVTLSALLFSCGNPREDAIQKIAVLEDSLFGGGPAMIDQVKADELIRAYIDYADTWPEDSLAPEYLYSAGDLMMNLTTGSGAVVLFERIRKDYPSHEKADEALFLQGFVTENHIGDLEGARSLYEEYIRLYPDEDFADDAEACIRNLGKTPEELIREFEERMKAESGDSLSALAE